MKIYCKNCRWFDEHWDCHCDRSSLFTRDELNHRGVRERVWVNKDVFLGLFQLSPTASSDEYYKIRKECIPNREFNCPIFERKWYKFWIKPKSNVDKMRITLEGLR
jgi:hypothetical protein